MTDLRKAAEMALEALEWNYGTDLCDIENCMAWLDKMNATIPAIRQAIEQAEKQKCPWPDGECTTCEKIESKPSLWFAIHKDGNVKYTTDSARAKGWKESGAYRLVRDYYTAPPKRKWVGLTDEEYDELMLSGDWGGSLIQATEAKLKEKNT